MVALSEVERESDRAIVEARSRLVRAVREASAQGMTQQQIARAIDRSPPEVSRLLRFQGTSPLARRVRKHRADFLKLVGEAGGSDVRVFGSLAGGTDDVDSDVDLLFTKGGRLGLLGLSALENAISDLIGAPVDLVPESAVRPGNRGRRPRSGPHRPVSPRGGVRAAAASCCALTRSSRADPRLPG